MERIEVPTRECARKIVPATLIIRESCGASGAAQSAEL